METKPLNTFYEDGNFIVEYEVHEGVAYLHCRVFCFNSKVLRKMYDVFAALQLYFEANKINTMRSITKNTKFCELLNGKTIGHVVHENERYEVVEWDSRF